MTGSDIALSGISLAYRGYMDWKFDRLFRKAEEHGLTSKELMNGDHRFALFMRVGRAFELCSEREVVDYLSEAMIGGVLVGDADRRPDFIQMALSSLSGVTRSELNIILLMRKHELWGATDEEVRVSSGFDSFYLEVKEVIGISELAAVAMLNGLTRTGLVTPQASGVGNSVTIQGNLLTWLARELFQYVDYARRLTC